MVSISDASDIQLAFMKQHQIKKTIIFFFANAQPSANTQLYLSCLSNGNFLNTILSSHDSDSNGIKLSHDYKMAD